jgi:dTDP-4-dehydrorhamnose reductase
MKLLIFGRGYLSSLLATRAIELGDEVLVYGSDRLPLTDRDAIRAVVEAEKPDRVINTSAFTNTAAAELPDNRAEAFRLNVEGPCTILEALRESETPWLHFSSGMLFDGVGPAGDGWKENDTPEPEGYYAWTKAFADGALSSLAEQSRLIIARIHLPISSRSHPRNFLNRLAGFERAVDVPSSVTVLDDALPAIDALFEREAYGLYNVVNPGAVSSYAILEAMQRHGHVPADRPIRPLSRAELDSMGGAKQVFPLLNTEKLGTHGLELPDIEESLEAVLSRFSPAAG